MKFNKIAKGAVLVTIGAFFISYLTAPTAKDGENAPFPVSLFQPWANSSIGMNFRDLKEVHIQKDFAADPIEKIHLQVESADIELMANDSDRITVEVVGHFAKVDPLEIEETLNELTLKMKNGFAGQGWNRFSYDFGDEGEATGKLRIGIPVTVRDLQIETVNGNITGNITSLRNLNIASISGDLTLNGMQVPVTQIATVSGDVNLGGKLASLSMVSVSGDVKITSENPAPAIKLHSTSGDIDLAFKTEADVNVSFKTVSGDFEILGKEQGKTVKLGNGMGQVDVETISGDLEIRTIQ